jgi:hypothetical protein
MANAPAGYKYSIDAFEINKYNTNRVSFPSIYGVKFNTSKSVMIDSQVVYRITIYKDSTVITDGGVQISGSTVKSRVLGSGAFATFKNSVKTICDVEGIRTIDDKFYDFTLVPKGINGTVSPKFTPQIELNGIWLDVTVVFGSATPSTIFISLCM